MAVLIRKNLFRLATKNPWNITRNITLIRNTPKLLIIPTTITLAKRMESNEPDKPKNKLESEQNKEPMSMKDKFKHAVAQYGATVIVFHVGISLTSLGICYVLVSNGVDVNAIVERLGIAESYGKIASNAGTFAVAYAIHKVFAPVRIGITVTATPFIVRYLRKLGYIKKRD